MPTTWWQITNALLLLGCIMVCTEGNKQQAFFRYGRSNSAAESGVDKRGMFRYGKRAGGGGGAGGDAAGSVIPQHHQPQAEVLWFDEDVTADSDDSAAEESNTPPTGDNNSSSLQTQRQQLMADAARLSKLGSGESESDEKAKRAAFFRYGRGFRYGKRLAAGPSQNVDKRTFRYGRSTA